MANSRALWTKLHPRQARRCSERDDMMVLDKERVTRGMCGLCVWNESGECRVKSSPLPPCTGCASPTTFVTRALTKMATDANW